MSSRSAAKRVAQEKAEFHNIETRLQYRNTAPLPFLVEKHMLPVKVKDVKRGLLSLEMMSFVTENPDDLEMHLVLPPNYPDQEYVLEPMNDEYILRYYLDNLGRCKMLKILPKQ